MLVDTGATSSCMSLATYLQNKKLGPLTPVKYAVAWANRRPLPVKGRTSSHLVLWGSNFCHTSFIVLGGLGGIPDILGMGVLAALGVVFYDTTWEVLPIRQPSQKVASVSSAITDPP